MTISKSNFVAGVQCLKRVYFQVHQPELATGSTEAFEAIMEQGQQVSLEAQKANAGPVIFEAMFEHGCVLVRLHILGRHSLAGDIKGLINGIQVDHLGVC
jgi:hypothetical protein